MRRAVELGEAAVLFIALGLPPVASSAAAAQENVSLSCEPRAFRVVAGEPMRLALTVEADSAAPIRLHVPADPSLILRAVERPPLRRTSGGAIVHRRTVIWQALKPATIKMDGISVETGGRKMFFPAVTIRVDEAGP